MIEILIAFTPLLLALLMMFLGGMFTPDYDSPPEIEMTLPMESIEPVRPEFEERTAEIFRTAKEAHPDLQEYDIVLSVEPAIPHPLGTVYGRHKPGSVHRIEISQQAHNSDQKLFDTVCHELAHVLDEERRGYSNHDDFFESCQEEIEAQIPELQPA